MYLQFYQPREAGSLPFLIATPDPLLGPVNEGPMHQESESGSYISIEFKGLQPSQPPTAQIRPSNAITAA